MEGIAEKAKKLGITIYIPSYDHDAALTRWYKNLIESGEFEKLFTQAYRPLSRFIKLFEPPTLLTLGIDEAGEVWMAAWLVPFDGGGGTSASFSAWARQDMRGTQKSKEARNIIYPMAFEVWDVLVSTTRQEGLLRYLRQIGYNVVGMVPDLIEGDDAWILYLTKENFTGDK